MIDYSSSTPPAGPPPPPPPVAGAPAGQPNPSAAAGPPSLPPRKPAKKPSRVLPILLGICVILGMGFMALTSFVGFFLSGADVSNFNPMGHEIVLLNVEGPIQPGPVYDFWMESLADLATDENIKGIVLRVDSPGGTVANSQEMYDMIRTLRDPKIEGHTSKKVYVSMGNVAASGAYYLAAATDRIYANRGTLTGSIGVISSFMNYESLAEKVGVEFDVVKTGRFKDVGSSVRPMTEDDRRVFDILIDDALDQFLTDILKERTPALEAAAGEMTDELWEFYMFDQPAEANAATLLREVADGRIYSGAQAKSLGLVDELAPLHDVISALAVDLGLEPDASVFEPQMRIGFFDMLTASAADVIPEALNPAAHSIVQYRMMH